MKKNLSFFFMTGVIILYEPTTYSAKEYANQNILEEWVHEFLCGEGDNKEFSEGLKREKRYFKAPKIMSLDLFKRCYGPEPGMKYHIPPEDKDQLKNFWININSIAKRYSQGDWDMPPLIVEECDGVLELNDGNHRYEALKSLGINQYWVIVWGTV
ncbi:MAG: ParB N-terminal domain-containing protein [Clostridiales bacterium]|nr:ParB N-terminal domain-containing protein [Clostridiales bacterium]